MTSVDGAPALITVAGIPVVQPIELIAGYAFAQVEDPPGRSPDGRYAPDPPTHRPRWGYRTYDCVPPTGGHRLAGVDLLIAAGLNGDLTVGRVGAIQAAAPEVSNLLRALDASPPFWELTADEVDEPSEGTMGHHLCAAWEVLMRQPDLGVALTHKTLHHKRPHLFPLVDNKTLEALPKGHAWRAIHGDLTGQAEAWTRLEQAFGGLLERETDSPLTRLRLHDILLWLMVVKEHGAEAELAREKGREILRQK